jgi:hypothetical protein
LALKLKDPDKEWVMEELKDSGNPLKGYKKDGRHMLCKIFLGVLM